MKTLKEALEARAECAKNLKALQTRAEGDAWNEEKDGPELDAAISALEEADKVVERMRKVEDLNKRSAGWTSDDTAGAPVSVNVIQSRGDDPDKIRKEYRLIDAIRMVASDKGLSGIYAEMQQEADNEARTLRLPDASTGNLQIPGLLMSRNTERRDITATTTTTGGHTIATELGGLIEFLDPRLTVRDMGATYMPGMVGNMDFPRNDASATAVWAAAENTTSTETTPTFDKLSLSPKRITAFTDVSKQNLLQTSIPMENFVRNRLNRAAANLLETACISGTGSNGQPTGILTQSGTNDITIGDNGGVLTWALTTQFESETAIDNADMGRLGYLTTPGVANLLKNTKRDVAGNGFIWEGPNMEAVINGYRAKASNFMPSNLTKGTSSGVCHAMIFGNWEELMIAQWGGLDLMINPYTKGKEALIEIIIHSWFDLGVRHAVSFCKCDEITLS